MFWKRMKPAEFLSYKLGWQKIDPILIDDLDRAVDKIYPGDAAVIHGESYLGFWRYFQEDIE